MKHGPQIVINQSDVTNEPARRRRGDKIRHSQPHLAETAGGQTLA
jgi:hypothetical protein